MTPERYKKLTDWLEGHPALREGIILLNRWLPLVPKSTRGNSCPSRHALSAAVLGMVWLYFYPAVGVGMLAIAALICLLRVLSGVHFIRDVLVGAAFGLAFGFAGMWLL